MENLNDNEAKLMSFGLNFISKKKKSGSTSTSSVVATSNAFQEEEESEKEESFLKPKVAEAPLVIPLITRDSTDAEIEAAALAELLNVGKDGSSVKAKVSTTAAIPMPSSSSRSGGKTLLQRSARGKTDEERYQNDINSRPDEPDLDAYARVPVESIGEAMLRGMGWTTGGAVGGTNAQVVEPVEFVPRPGRVGIGAKLSDVVAPTHKKAASKMAQEAKRRIARGEDPNEVRGLVRADGTFVGIKRGNDSAIVSSSAALRRIDSVGARVLIVKGRHEGLTGVVEKEAPSGPDEKLVVRLSASGEAINVKRKYLQAAAATGSAQQQHSNANGDSAVSEKKKKKRKRGDEEDGDVKTSAKTKSSKSERSDSVNSAKKQRRVWVRPGLRVRVVSKSFANGRYYEKKVKVVDVLSGSEFLAQLDDGRVAEGLKQSMVETVIAKEGGRCMIVGGDHAGQYCTVRERKKKEQSAVVQLEEDLSYATVHYDDLCEVA